MLEKMKYTWKKIYAYILPTFFTIAYLVYLFCIYEEWIDCKALQDSKQFKDMLQTLVTFMSIILSVFGFLIPSFLGSKGESATLKYFIKYADMKLFAAKLKNIVAVGLVDIFITCILLLTDIMPPIVLNIMLIIWLWLLFFFMCSSYRFISLMISLLLTEKKNFVQKAGNNVSEDVKKKLHQDINSN
ncbi:hypothetical protein [Roseburia inulinivorans]|jgi:hypothetical protein|uniref:Uncharacterized protein n=1 Tax=Roseburia inulinivorans TaxID=360807 RepID=A0A3R6A7R2_9FIRM|nr:hypothetical protein [Roseburia inulinivorans]RHA81358.1 hypothetical protein DW914_19240 [Roseburia inulinivorans]